MKKRILAIAMAITMLFGSESITYAAQTSGITDAEQMAQQTAVLTPDEIITPDEVVTPDEVQSEQQIEEIETVGEDTPLAAPQNLVAQADSYQSVRLAWNAVEGAAGYHIYYGTSAANAAAQTPINATADDAVEIISGLDCGTTYYFYICAYDATMLEGAASAVVSAATTLNAPVFSSAQVTGYQSVKLNWTQVAGATGYVIQRSTNRTSGFQTVQTINSANTKTYTDKSVTTGTTYYYKIQAYRTVNGSNIYSAETGVRAVKPALQPVTLNSVRSVNYKTAKITWTRNKQANGYYVYRATSETGKYERIATVKKSASTSYSDKTCVTGQTYYYKIKAYRAVSGQRITSKYSNVASGKASVKAPVLASAKSAAYNKITLSWNKVTGANGYVVYRSTSKNGTYKKVKTITSANTLTYTDTRRTTGKRYYYKVRAYRKVSGKNQYGVYSNIKAATPVPAKTTKLTATAKNGKKITLNWNKVAGADYYVVTRSTEKNGTYSVVKKKTTKLTYTNSGLSANKRYYYKIYAVRNGVEGKLSSVAATTAFNFRVNKTAVTIYRGTSEKVTAASSGSAKITWKSSNPSIATVSANGRIKGVSVGTTTVTAKSHGTTLSVKVTVTTRLDGIDVSHWQGTIDWNAVKASGIDFAILKATEGVTYTDPTFETNYAGATAAGLKVGCYGFSHATNVNEAVSEATFLLSKIGNKKMGYPVVLDFESADILAVTDNTIRTDIIFAYKSVIEAAGYKFAVYANYNWLTNYIDNSRLAGVDIWIARYNTVHGYTGGGNLAMWQYTSSGTVSGIAGRVDMNYSYKGY